MENNKYILEFQSNQCKKKEHNNCSKQWKGFGFTIICTCNCHKEIYEKNIVLDEPCKPSNTYCSNHILNLTAEAETKYDYWL
jgi:hypothetical protein